ncbi:MAG: hypothetical protein WAW17_04490 [Rhodococcus sp. (in: high G+C Gram-positive bacteria)]|uniref:hypothetical protein n=1 Tax=Rhodococcus sp. TaxID=1831 RepID=UPI003BB1F94A
MTSHPADRDQYRDSRGSGFAMPTASSGSLHFAPYQRPPDPPLLRMFPATSEAAEKYTMIALYAIEAAAIIFIALRVAGVL